MTPAEPVPRPRRFLLGLSGPQMGFAFLGGVGFYLLCTFWLTGLAEPRWGLVGWRDVLTFAVIVILWIAIALYNRAHPDEETRLHLND
jgi:hypothetical protein